MNRLGGEFLERPPSYRITLHTKIFTRYKLMNMLCLSQRYIPGKRRSQTNYTEKQQEIRIPECRTTLITVFVY